jgi:pantoate kinase
VKAKAFSPCHITGFFEIHDQHEDPLFRGSRGVGVSLEMGVVTKVLMVKSKRTKISVTINGRQSEAPVSMSVMKRFLSMAGGEYEVSIEHFVLSPIGAGFGSSGAGSLSLALASNEALGLNLSRMQAAQVAHLAEIECKTGLGTVIAEMCGGFEVRTKAGAPGVGKVERLPIEKDRFIVSVSFGSMPTKEVLVDPEVRARINRAGKRAMNGFLKVPSVKSFLTFSRRFSDEVALASNRVRRLVNEADKMGISCSMNMIGDGVFTLVKEEEAEEVLTLFDRHAREGGRVIVSAIDFEGAKLI